MKRVAIRRKPRTDPVLPELDLAHNPSCGCGCNDYEPEGCPIPAPGIDNRWCVNYPTLNCHCIALVSQGLCEGCYVATK